MGKSTAVIIILLLLLLISIGYIGYGVYNSVRQEKEFVIYQQGAQLGYEQAVAQLFQSALQCQQVPVTYNNQTINVIAVECFQAAS